MLALRGALRSLDPYSTIFSGRTTEDFRIRFSGKLSGIGSRIGRRDGHLTAMKVFPKSPAEKGGLRDGDWILTIDGDPTQPLSLSEAVDRLRGKAGSRVLLGVQRSDEEKDDQRLEIEIVRGEVQVPNVEARMLDDSRIGYAEIASVSRTTSTEFRKKVIDLGEIEGLVLDLRSNSGGSMLAAQQLADLSSRSSSSSGWSGATAGRPDVRTRRWRAGGWSSTCRWSSWSAVRRLRPPRSSRARWRPWTRSRSWGRPPSARA